MKKLIYLILFLVTSSQASAQSGWSITYPAYWTLYDMQFVNQVTAYCAGTVGTVLKSTDGGNSWVRLITGTPVNLFSVSFLNELTGWAAGSIFVTGSGTWSVMIKTTDGGSSWNTVSNIYAADGYYIVKFLNTSNGILLTRNIQNGFDHSNGLVYTTANGGVNWTSIPLLNADYLSLNTVPNGNIFITARTRVGSTNDTGYVFKSTNNGANWMQMDKRAGKYFLTSSFINNSTGWFNSSSSIAKTTDGGVSFQLQTLTEPIDMLGIFMLNEQTGWVTTYMSEIYRTTNAGNNWIRQPIPGGSAISMYDMYIFNADTVAAAGQEALKTYTGGVYVNGIIKEGYGIPESFSLFQNYPNPFNPATNIRFSIPEKTFVKIIIYDILGRIVSEPVNTELSAGSYKFDWNAIGLASGIYYLSMVSGDFRVTKTMLLLK